MIPDPIGEALDWLRAGGMIAYPTETVWGLGADARSDRALARLRGWKGRDASAPISILTGTADDLPALGFEPDEVVRRLTDALWPGPVTLVIRCRDGFAAGIAREDGAVGVRCSSHPLAAALARRCAAERVGPITATSLNSAGAAPAATIGEAREKCQSQSDGSEDPQDTPRMLDIDGAEAGGDSESTVIDTTGRAPRVLRWGAIGKEELEPLFQEIGSR